MTIRTGMRAALLATLSILTSSNTATVDATAGRQLAAVRAAAAELHNVATAIADGYLPTDESATRQNLTPRGD